MIGRLNHIYKADLSHRAVSVYIYLYDRANKDGECWPSIPTIAKELKFSESTVRRALKDLRKEGFIVTEQRYRKHGGKSSLLYKLKMQWQKRKPSAKRVLYSFGGRWLLSSG